jgi:hypothetical protein
LNFVFHLDLKIAQLESKKDAAWEARPQAGRQQAMNSEQKATSSRTVAGGTFMTTEARTYAARLDLC